jgi:hypothetical protein
LVLSVKLRARVIVDPQLTVAPVTVVDALSVVVTWVGFTKEAIVV